jgi:hypothetical protein
VPKAATAPTRTPAVPETRYVVPPAQRVDDRRAPQRPPFGVEAGPERTPPPPLPSYGEIRKQAAPTAPATPRTPASARETPTVRVPAAPRPQASEPQPVRPATRPAQPAVTAPASRPDAPATQAPAAQPSERAPATPQGGEARPDARERPLPGQPASQTYRGRERDPREPR